MKKGKDSFYCRYIKRILDIFCALLAMIVFCWLYALIAILVRIKLGSPVIFKQARPGKNEKIFYLYKFRSMTDARDINGDLLPDRDRLTKFGRILRASSLDELPEAWNILKGDMSVVGPRPWSLYDLKYYSSYEKQRFMVAPGLSGWAQVNGRNAATWPERIYYDVDYVNRVSLSLDMKVILMTLKNTIKHKDIIVRGEGAANDFAIYRMMQEEKEKLHPAIKPADEIGSFFWLDGTEEAENSDAPVKWLAFGEDNSYTFSGREAILYALKDVIQTHNVRSAYLPSYCCDSMVEPFIELGIKLKFYDVSYNGKLRYAINYTERCDIFFAMSYFGFRDTQVDAAIKAFADRGITVIEDITHSLLMQKPYSEYSDYYIASLRKWFPVPTGGYIAKRVGKLSAKPSKSGEDAVREKVSSMHLKYLYLKGELDNKEKFLKMGQRFESSLIHVRDLKLDSISKGIIKATNIDELRAKRRKNAEVLINGLRNCKDVKLLFQDEYDKNCCPLFVPILLEKSKRDMLRSYLIERGIYCPIHWPEVWGTEPGIRENELSLICDQRYNEHDMNRVLSIIKAWVGIERELNV